MSDDKQNPPGFKVKTLKQATAKLKAEALRKYRQRHRSSLDRHEEELEKQMAGGGLRKKKSASPRTINPDIPEDALEPDVFEDMDLNDLIDSDVELEINQLDEKESMDNKTVELDVSKSGQMESNPKSDIDKEESSVFVDKPKREVQKGRGSMTGGPDDMVGKQDKETTSGVHDDPPSSRNSFVSKDKTELTSVRRKSQEADQESVHDLQSFPEKIASPYRDQVVDQDTATTCQTGLFESKSQCVDLEGKNLEPVTSSGKHLASPHKDSTSESVADTSPSSSCENNFPVETSVRKNNSADRTIVTDSEKPEMTEPLPASDDLSGDPVSQEIETTEGNVDPNEPDKSDSHEIHPAHEIDVRSKESLNKANQRSKIEQTNSYDAESPAKFDLNESQTGTDISNVVGDCREAHNLNEGSNSHSVKLLRGLDKTQNVQDPSESTETAVLSDRSDPLTQERSGYSERPSVDTDLTKPSGPRDFDVTRESPQHQTEEKTLYTKASDANQKEVLEEKINSLGSRDYGDDRNVFDVMDSREHNGQDVTKKDGEKSKEEEKSDEQAPVEDGAKPDESDVRAPVEDGAKPDESDERAPVEDGAKPDESEERAPVEDGAKPDESEERTPVEDGAKPDESDTQNTVKDAVEDEKSSIEHHISQQGETKEGDPGQGQDDQGKDGQQTEASSEDAIQGSEESKGQIEQQDQGSVAVSDGQNAEIGDDEDDVVDDEVQEEKTQIPDDFYYNLPDHVSKPVISEKSCLPEDIISLQHSFGYDCLKRANLHVLDENTVVFAAGNVVQLLNVKTKEQKYIRSTGGGGIGALTVHPGKKYFAVGEKGTTPNINIYEYPSLKLYRILRGGTEEAYTYTDFSPDGKLLASVGGDPDYMLTLWDWKQEKIVLRSKAFSQDVFRVTFSTELQGQLTSSGTGHIRFWKMAKTFTGLKLQGQLGKFGKKEISDIEGYVELPDGKVLSGTETGNLMLWDGGLIKVEIARKNKKPCHAGSITQIIMDEGELMTIGVDGYIRVWDFETVDTADITDESDVFEMEPMNELKVGNDVQLRSLVKSADQEEPTMWYAQDGNGGIWKLDLSFSFTSQAPERLMTYHAGPITGCTTSPVSHLVATIGTDKTVRVYDYLTNTYLCQSKYSSPGSCVIWAPKLVDTKGATVLAGFEDGVVRVLTFQKKETIDVHGRKHKDQSELALIQAFKPHNKSLNSMAIDNKGELLATGSDDCTVFFLTVGNNYEPVGFIKTPSPVTHLQWSPEHFKSSTLLVCCREGQILEVESPEDGNFDTSHTFEITGLRMRIHHFKSIKSRLRHDEEMERKAKEEEERRKQEEEERRIRIERGLETESEQGDDEEESKEPVEEPWEPYIPEEPSPILHGFYTNEEGKFWLSMGGFDAGYLYECQFLDDGEKAKLSDDDLYQPIRTVPVVESNDVSINTMQFSKHSKYLVMGLNDGRIRIQPLTEEDVGQIDAYWSLRVHDNHYGNISHIATSFDDRYLFSVGKDGNFFTFDFMEEGKIEEKIAETKAKIPSARKDLEDKRIDDIEDPNAYSIEDAKQKAEYDKMMKLAEEKKAGVRRTIESLRSHFRTLLDRNKHLPQHLQLDKKEFEVDPGIKKELRRHTEEKIEMVKKEMAWEEEKHRIALEKLRFRFKDIVECERIVVWAFQTEQHVSSFRASKLADDFYTAKADMERRKTTFVSKDEMSRLATKDLLKSRSQHSDKLEDADRGSTESKITTNLKGSMGERINKALAKVEEKKKRRAQRKCQWAELNDTKPSHDYEDPADVAAIKEAKLNMGDYKLKSSDDYVVPDHLRMNTDKARSRLLTIKELIHNHKYDFNQKLLSLRDKKIRVIQDICDLIRQLDLVQAKLGPEKSRPLPDVPQMNLEELPEKKYEYTRETLLKFKQEMEARREQQLRGVPSGGFGGFGGGAAGTDIINKQSPSITPSIYSQKQVSAITSDTDFSYPMETTTSELQLHIKEAEEIRLLYERDRLFNAIQGLLKNFDAELRCLRHEKFKMDIDMKNADLRHVTLFEELLLLKDFEKREDVLATKVENKEQEKLEMQAKVIDVQQKLESKKKDIEKWQEKEKTLNATFVTSLGENNKFAEFLTKVFKKRIKRSKKKATEGEVSDAESDDDSDNESDWSESEEESDSEAGGYDLDVCPQGCDQTLYDNTCGLREKRLDIEEGLAEEKKTRDTLNRDLESLQKRAKVINVGLKSAEQELEAFQLEKQRKLNELFVVVTLKFHQVQYMLNNTLPQDLSPCLVFEAVTLLRLAQRIKELEHEKTLQKKQQKEAKKKHVQLIKDRRLFDQRIGEMEEQCNKMMIDKFGCIVDLEKLEQVTVNRQIEELKEKLRLNELQSSQEICKWEETIQDAKDHITSLIRENTNKLDQLNMLLGERKTYETELDSKQQKLGSEFSGARKADLHERQRLIQLVHLQAQEIEALKEEITLLSRKGGHILPPAQPPLSHSSQGQRPIPNP